MTRHTPDQSTRCEGCNVLEPWEHRCCRPQKPCSCFECRILHHSFSGVLAGAYLRWRKDQSTLIHAVLRDQDNVVVTVLCGRVSAESMSDDMHAPGVEGPATCTRCRTLLRGLSSGRNAMKLCVPGLRPDSTGGAE